jgi:hypothetical protein
MTMSQSTLGIPSHLDRGLYGTVDLEKRAVLWPFEAVEPEEVLQISGRVKECHAAGFLRQALVREVQADGRACKQVLAFHVGQPVRLVPVHPVHGLAPQGSDQLQEAEVVTP